MAQKIRCSAVITEIKEGKKVKLTIDEYNYFAFYVLKNHSDFTIVSEINQENVLIYKKEIVRDEKAKIDFTYTMFVDGIWWVCE